MFTVRKRIRELMDEGSDVFSTERSDVVDQVDELSLVAVFSCSLNFLRPNTKNGMDIYFQDGVKFMMDIVWFRELTPSLNRISRRGYKTTKFIDMIWIFRSPTLQSPTRLKLWNHPKALGLREIMRMEKN